MHRQLEALAELEGLDLGDKRREARIRRLVEALQDDPAAHFPSAVRTLADREGLYRAFSNEHVTLEALIAPHVAQAVERMARRAERPLVVIDKTTFVFGGEADRDGLERISPRKQGFDAFVALGVSSSRQPHGVVAAEPTETMGTSSAVAWSAVVDAAAKAIELRNLQPIFVMDREADAYDLFQMLVGKNRDFVIRVSFDRNVREYGSSLKERLRDVTARAATTLKKTVRLSRRPPTGRSSSARKKHPARASRDATLTVRACPVTLPKPALAKGPAELSLHLVQVIEQDPPDGCDPIEWLLATTLPIQDATCVEAIVDAYRARWTVEEFFKALKTGCSFEKRQLESLHALLNALGVLIPLAWRLLALRCLADDEPDASAAELFVADELHVLRKLSTDIKLDNNPTAANVVLALARLGGHFPQNGRPGWLVIWRGLQKVLDRVEGYRLARAEM